MPDEAQVQAQDKPDEEAEQDIGEKMDADFDLGNEFKDQLIPLALEYYLEAIDNPDDEEEEDEECEDHGHHGGHGHHHHHDDDEEDDDKPKKSKKAGKPKDAAKGADKQQECKQQWVYGQLISY